MSQRLYLVAYDIADPKRLGRVARYLCQHACRVQYSVFAAPLSQSQLHHLFSKLESMIDPKQDDVRAYPLPAVGDVTLLGQQFFAANTLLVKNGQSRLELVQSPADRDALSEQQNLFPAPEKAHEPTNDTTLSDEADKCLKKSYTSDSNSFVSFA